MNTTNQENENMSGDISEKKWTKERKLICSTVSSDGTTGIEWIARLQKKNIIFDDVKDLLLSEDFRSTSGITSKVVILKASLFKRIGHYHRKFEDVVKKYNLKIPNAEVACLIREKFADEDIKAMELEWLIVLHEPIKNSKGKPLILGVHSSNYINSIQPLVPGPSFDPKIGFVLIGS